MTDFGTPVLALCGFSGSGKTTLLEAAVPKLVAQGLALAVVKHDEHGFEVDRAGKDSDRLFRCGATVALSGPGQQFQHRHGDSSLSLEATLTQLAADHDLILVEGHKYTPLPKLWVQSAENTPAPEGVCGVIAELAWNSDRLTTLLNFLQVWLPKEWRKRSFHCGILAGAPHNGADPLARNAHPSVDVLARAMAELRRGRLPLGEVVRLGGEEAVAESMPLVRIPSVPDASGEMAMLLAAHRWAPASAWLIASHARRLCEVRDVERLFEQRRPGCWAIVSPAGDEDAWPALALYEPQAMQFLERRLLTGEERSLTPGDLLQHPRTVVLHGLRRG